MSTSISIEEFLIEPGITLDVRSPSEYNHAHIPGAINLPLFSDEERAAIGTKYKQKGQQKAIDIGFAFASPKLADFVANAKKHVDNNLAKVHCWRGGMRSAFARDLLDNMRIPSCSLNGGYKAFRNWALDTIAIPKKLLVVGGFTGSGKTDILHSLRDLGEQVLDLEAIANHRGSSYGGLGKPEQPSTEYFENIIATELATFDPNIPIWVEDESRLIGRCKIPDIFFTMIREAHVLKIERPKSERLENIRIEYGSIDPELLVEATQRLLKRFGGVRTQEASKLFREGNFVEATDIVLDYYDKAYHYGLSKRISPIIPISGEGLSSQQWAQLLRATVSK